MRIITAATSEEIRIAQDLLREYWKSFGFDPAFQGFSSELGDLQTRYAPPQGRIALAFIEHEPAGCIAMRRVDERTAEAKRLYVRDQFRGQGVGGLLLKWLIAEARSAGYSKLVCDTLPSMFGAIKMYETSGFQRTGPYGSNPTPGAIYFSLGLEKSI